MSIEIRVGHPHILVGQIWQETGNRATTGRRVRIDKVGAMHVHFHRIDKPKQIPGTILRVSFHPPRWQLIEDVPVAEVFGAAREAGG